MTETFLADPDPSSVPFDALRDFYQIWLDIKAREGLPARSHFSFTVLKDHLPYLAFIDHEKATGRFKVRLIGTSYSQVIGFEATGKYIEEMPNAEGMKKRYEWLVEHRAPYFASMDSMKWGKDEYRNYAVLGCPLFDEKGDVNMLIFRVSFERLNRPIPPDEPDLLDDE
jgi:hypothetical protein